MKEKLSRASRTTEERRLWACTSCDTGRCVCVRRACCGGHRDVGEMERWGSQRSFTTGTSAHSVHKKLSEYLERRTHIQATMREMAMIRSHQHHPHHFQTCKLSHKGPKIHFTYLFKASHASASGRAQKRIKVDRKVTGIDRRTLPSREPVKRVSGIDEE